MSFHYALPGDPEECGYGENCPVETHFETLEDALANLEKAVKLSLQRTPSPLSDFDAGTLVYLLKVLTGLAGGTYPPTPETLIKNYGAELMEEYVETLAREGWLNCVHDTATSFVDGEEVPLKSGFRWKSTTDRNRFNPNNSLSARAKAFLELAQVRGEEIYRAKDELNDVELESDRLVGFKETIATIQSNSPKLREKANARYMERAQILMEDKEHFEDFGYLSSEWRAETLARLWDCSPATVTTTGKRLVELGLMTCHRQYDRFDRRCVITTYTIHRQAIAHLGGIEKLLTAS